MERPIAQISSAGSGPGKISHTYDLRYLLNRHNLDSASPDEAFRRIVDGIWSTIDRDSWQRCGGTREDLRLVHGRLTVAIAPENLFALDNALRAAFSRRSLGVAIECRAMVIPADALKELGADWRLSPMAPGLFEQAQVAMVDDLKFSFFWQRAGVERQSYPAAPRIISPDGGELTYAIGLQPAIASRRAAAVNSEVDHASNIASVRFNLTPWISADRRRIDLAVDGIQVSDSPLETAVTPTNMQGEDFNKSTGVTLPAPDGAVVLIATDLPAASIDPAASRRLVIAIRPAIPRSSEGIHPVFVVAGGILANDFFKSPTVDDLQHALGNGVLH